MSIIMEKNRLISMYFGLSIALSRYARILTRQHIHSERIQTHRKTLKCVELMPPKKSLYLILIFFSL